MTPQPTRTLEQVRETILTMPFAQAMRLDIESASDGAGVVSMPLSDVVTFNGTAFAAMAVGALADMAAGAATLITLPPSEMALTGKIDSEITASTAGERLSATASLRDRDDTMLIFDVVVSVQGSDGASAVCGTAAVTMRVARPRTKKAD